MSVTATFTVTGMTCGHCVQAVTDEITALDGVEKVDVELSSGAVTVVSAEALTTGRRRRCRRRGRLRPCPMSESVELTIGGMTCASCAARIEKKLNKLDGRISKRQLRH